MDKSEIGAHLNGLPPATARGLHNLFNKLLDEIHALRAQLNSPADDEPEPTSDLLPGAGDKDPEAPPEGSAPIVVTKDGTIIESAGAPADVPPAA